MTHLLVPCWHRGKVSSSGVQLLGSAPEDLGGPQESWGGALPRRWALGSPLPLRCRCWPRS